MLGTLTDAFFASIESTSKAFREGLAQRDWRRAALAIHTMKGSAASLGAQRLAAMCAQLEPLLRAGAVGDAASWQTRVDGEIDAALQALRSFLAGRA